MEVPFVFFLIGCYNYNDCFQLSHKSIKLFVSSVRYCMRIFKLIRLILAFYRSFYLATGLITICCVSIFWKYGLSTFAPILWFKLLTLYLTFYFINAYQHKTFYYYQNLGISRTVLWVVVFSIDLLIFFLSLILIYQLK